MNRRKFSLTVLIVVALCLWTGKAFGRPFPQQPTARLGKGTVEKIAYTPDGKLLAVAGSLGIWLYDVADLAEIGLLELPIWVDSWVYYLAISPDGKTIAAGYDLEGIHLWDVETKQHIGQLEGFPFDFSPDGETIALGGWNDIRLWDVKKQQQVGVFEGHTGGGSSLDFSSDGNTLASASSDGIVRLWDVETQQQIGLLHHSREHTVRSVAFSPDGKLLASGAHFSGGVGDVRLWDVETQQQVALLLECDVRHTAVSPVTFSPDGKTIISWCQAGDVHLWDVGTKEEVAQLEGNPVFDFSPDGKTIAFTTASGSLSTIQLLDLETKQQVGALSVRSVGSLAFNPDGKTLASSSVGSTVRFWDVETKQQVGMLEHTGKIWGPVTIAFTADGKNLASMGSGGVWLWDVEAQQRVGVLEGASGVLALSPNGNLLASEVPYLVDIQLWDVETQTQVGVLVGEGGVSLAFSPDGKILASGGWNSIRLWDVRTKQQVGQLNEDNPVIAPRIDALAFSHDGKKLASANNHGVVRLWDVETKQQVWVLEDASGPLAFSPDEKILASGGLGGVWLWDVETKQPVGVLEGKINSLAFSPDGKFLASGGTCGWRPDCTWQDSTVRLWDVESQEQVALLEGPSGALAFSPDGKWLASGIWDGVILLWELGTGSPWDVNSDGIVDVFDLVQVAAQFGQSGLEFNGDVNRDGEIDVLDLVLVGSHFGEHVILAAPPMKVSFDFEPSPRLNQR